MVGIDRANHTNIFCPSGQCRGKTTRHSLRDGNYACTECGSVKTPNKPRVKSVVNTDPSSMRGKFEHKLKIALGLIKEESDSPVKFKPDGKKRKTSAGAHRFDDGVDYYQMKNDWTWNHKADENTIK